MSAHGSSRYDYTENNIIYPMKDLARQSSKFPTPFFFFPRQNQLTVKGRRTLHVDSKRGPNNLVLGELQVFVF